MPSTKTSPKQILSDLGYERVDLESEEDYLRALMEAASGLTITNPADESGRIKILQQEIRRVRKRRKAANPSPGMTVTQKKITGAAFKRGSSVGGAENVAGGDTGGGAIVQAGAPGAIQQAAGISQSPVTPSLLKAVQAIGASVNNIIGILERQLDVQQDAAEDARVDAEEKEATGREKSLEAGGKILSGLKKTGEKILKPVKNLFFKIFDFFMNVFLGRAFVKIIEWFSDPANKEKISSLFKFLKDWWPAIVAGFIAFAAPVLGPVGVIAGVVALLMWGVPKVLDAAAFVGGLVGKVWAFLKGGPEGDNKVDTSTRKQDRHGDPKGGDKEGREGASQLEQGKEQQQQQEVNQSQESSAKMASGGEVPGSGDKDTVPVKDEIAYAEMSSGSV